MTKHQGAPDPLTDGQGNGRISLTDRHLKAYARGRAGRDVWDAEQPGLMVRVLPSGTVDFSVRYRFGGQRRRLKLGSYPALSLQAARKRARAAQNAIDNGQDPAADQKAAKAPKTDTVEALAADYLKRHARPHKRSADEDERIINADILTHWQARSVRDLSRRDVRELLDRVVDRGAGVMANRVLAVVRKMLNFAVDHEWIEANPAARIKKPAPETSRDRVLTDDEIRSLWRLLSNLPTTADKPAPGRKRAKASANGTLLCPISPWLAAAMKVRLLTAQRGGEVAKMRWSDLDLETGWWTIPGSDTKNGEQHRVPLVPDVVALIKSQQKPTAGKAAVGTKDDADTAVYVFTRSGDATSMDRSKKASARLSRALGFDFRGHDLRRTAATNMAAAGVPREHIGQVLNHVEGGARATRVYDRHSYDPQKRTALETWSRELTRILKNEKVSNVVPIRQEARA